MPLLQQQRYEQSCLITKPPVDQVRALSRGIAREEEVGAGHKVGSGGLEKQANEIIISIRLRSVVICNGGLLLLTSLRAQIVFLRVIYTVHDGKKKVVAILLLETPPERDEKQQKVS